MAAEYNQNGDKPKRRQAETATNHNGDIHFKLIFQSSQNGKTNCEIL